MSESIVIQAAGVKREVPLPFGVCISTEDAELIVNRLQTFIASDAVYGWVDIVPNVEHSPDTPARAWND